MREPQTQSQNNTVHQAPLCMVPGTLSKKQSLSTSSIGHPLPKKNYSSVYEYLDIFTCGYYEQSWTLLKCSYLPDAHEPVFSQHIFIPQQRRGGTSMPSCNVCL